MTEPGGPVVGAIRSADSLEEAAARIRSCRAELEAGGVRYLALFGSLVHAEDRAASDVDVLYELAPGAKLASGFYEGAELKTYLTELLGRDVDLVPRERVRRELKSRIHAEAVAVIGGPDRNGPLGSRPAMSLPPREWRFRLDDMVDAAERIQERAAGRTQADLEGDAGLQDSLAWRFQVLGEAVRNLPTEVKDRHPSVPWDGMRAFRNRIVHGYFDIDPEKLWTVATDELPPLIPLLRTVRDQEAAPPNPEPPEPGPELEA